MIIHPFSLKRAATSEDTTFLKNAFVGESGVSSLIQEKLHCLREMTHFHIVRKLLQEEHSVYS